LLVTGKQFVFVCAFQDRRLFLRKYDPGINPLAVRGDLWERQDPGFIKMAIPERGQGEGGGLPRA
jgi:hypothetical protein